MATRGLRQLAMGAEIDYERSTVNHLLSGKRRPGAAFLIRLLLYLWENQAVERPEAMLEGVALLGLGAADVKSLPDIRCTLTAGEWERWGHLRVWLESFGGPRMNVRYGLQLPEPYVERTELSAQLRNLLSGPAAQIAEKRIVLWGMGGSGKSVLAQATALDERVGQFYRNGVLWAELGPQGEPALWLRQWCRMLDLAHAADESVWGLNKLLREHLSDPDLRFSIVLDDVWRAGQATPLLVGGEQCVAIITTREMHVVDKLGPDVRVVEVGEMTREEGLRLVERRVGKANLDDQAAAALADLVEDLPLALALGAAKVVEYQRRGVDGWALLLEQLRTGKNSADVLALRRPERRDQSLRRTLDASYDGLETGEREAFLALSALAGTSFSVAEAAEVLAQDRSDAEARLCELVDSSLLQRVTDEGKMRYRFQRLVGEYAAERAREG